MSFEGFCFLVFVASVLIAPVMNFVNGFKPLSPEEANKRPELGY